MRMLIKKIYICILLIVTLLYGLVACSTLKSDQVDIKKEDEINNKPIVVYRNNYDWTTRDAVSAYKIKNGFDSIKEEIFTDYSEMIKRFTTELMVGEGPDVIKGQPNIFGSIDKIINTGILTDLQPLIEEDEEFIITDYYENIVNSGLIDKKMYFIPLGFRVPTLWTTQSIIDNSEREFDFDNWTWDNFIEYAKKYASDKSNTRFFINNEYEFLDCLLMSSGINFIDFKEKRTNYDFAQIIKLFEVYKELHKEIENAFCPQEELQNYKHKYYDMFKEKSLMFISDSWGSMLNPGKLWMCNSCTQYYLKEEVAILPFPKYNKESKYIAVPNSIVAINSNAKNKTGSFELIKLMLTVDLQTDGYFMNTEGIPINKEAYRFMAEKYTGSEGIENIGSTFGRIPTIPLPEKLRKQSEEILNSVSYCYNIDSSIKGFIYEALYKYINDESTVEQSVKELYNKIMLYINE